MSETIKALGFALMQMGVGSLVGRTLDNLLDRVHFANTSALVRFLTQFSLGMPLLGGAVMLSTGGYFIESPIGDSSLVFWFYIGQPGLLHSVNKLELELIGDVFGSIQLRDLPPAGDPPATGGQLSASGGRFMARP